MTLSFCATFVCAIFHKGKSENVAVGWTAECGFVPDKFLARFCEKWNVVNSFGTIDSRGLSNIGTLLSSRIVDKS